jgi:hypothetical protein
MRMRAEEQKALARIMANPLKMKEIRSAAEARTAGAADSGGASSSRHRHDEKKHKKHKKHKHHHKEHKEHKHRRDDKERRHHRSGRERPSDSGSDSEPERAPVGGTERSTGTDNAAPAALARPTGYGLVRYSGGQRVESAAESAACRDAPPSAPPASLAPPTVAPARPLTTAAYGRSSDGRKRHEPPRRSAPMSTEEREARLRAMMADADAHDADRAKRARTEAAALRDRHGVEEAAAQHAAAAARDAAADDDEHVPRFVSDVANASYSSSSVADRINQQSHYVQRGSRAGAESFTRR